MRTYVLNGWAASPVAWSGCGFPFDRLYSYNEALDGEFERDLVAGQSPVFGVGWSMGGSVLLESVARRPRLFAGLLVVAASPRMMRDDFWKGMSEMRLAALRKGLDYSLAGSVMFPVPEPNPYMADSEENLSRGLDYLRHVDCRAALVEASRRGDFDSLPVVIFQSRRDAVVGAHNARFLAEVFPRAELVEVEGTEHALPVTEAARIGAAARRMQGILQERTK